MGIHINAHDAMDAMFLATEERGKAYVYEPMEPGLGCRNWHIDTDEPGCIVGLAVHRLGVSAEIMRTCDTGGVETLREALLKHDVTMTDAAVKVFKIAQVVQDNRGPWGAAVAAASQTMDIFRIVETGAMDDE